MRFFGERFRSSRSREAVACYLFISPAILYLLFLAVGPIIASLLISFTAWDVLTPPQWVGLDNYREMFFEDPLFWKSLWNTTYFTLIVVPLATILPLLVAMLLNAKVRGQGFFRTFFYLPSIVPVVASSILWLWLLHPQYGMVNGLLAMLGRQGPDWMFSVTWSKPAIIIATLWGMIGGPSMLIYLAGLQGVPVSYYEAAEIDGAGPVRKFIQITIPMMSPYIFFTLVM
ncbi:MAG TPA: sugar ABC transporter permease, partial [Candidatus Sumerlaeota bacterium]|nr:sugar ABC transporter permease [Candidatus Sumerlaeota bacterium]